MTALNQTHTVTKDIQKTVLKPDIKKTFHNSVQLPCHLLSIVTPNPHTPDLPSPCTTTHLSLPTPYPTPITHPSDASLTLTSKAHPKGFLHPWKSFINSMTLYGLSNSSLGRCLPYSTSCFISILICLARIKLYS